MGALPLTSVRVVDLGMFWAGPYAGRLLGDLGAEVIKVESARRPDPLRVLPRGLFPDRDPGARPWNRSGMINERNRNKLGITLDLTAPEGAALFKDLVKVSDVVLENFSARVMDGFGLGYEALREVNPQLIMISLASQGMTGPERDYVSVANIVGELGGLTGISGYPDEPPSLSVGYPDPMGALTGAGAVLTALFSRQRTGQGVYIDVSQRQMVASFLGEAILDYTMNGRIWGPQGNRHPAMAPHGAYRCRGEDAWVTLAVGTDQQWRALCRLLERPDLADAPRFADSLARHRHAAELQEVIEAWTSQRSHYEAMALLQGAGIPAGAVLNAEELLEDPHLAARGYFETVTHPEAGTHRYQGHPVRLTKTPNTTRLPAPLLGQHTTYVLHELLKLSEEQVQELEQKGIIGNVPLAPVEEYRMSPAGR
ncbi:MAG: CoA transferase [Chloroflexi bacterium]|nr:CoA transferase [Chloroflexota bacterium]